MCAQFLRYIHTAYRNARLTYAGRCIRAVFFVGAVKAFRTSVAHQIGRVARLAVVAREFGAIVASVVVEFGRGLHGRGHYCNNANVSVGAAVKSSRQYRNARLAIAVRTDAVFFVGPVSAIVLSVANEIVRHARHLVGARE